VCYVACVVWRWCDKVLFVTDGDGKAGGDNSNTTVNPTVTLEQAESAEAVNAAPEGKHLIVIATTDPCVLIGSDVSLLF